MEKIDKNYRKKLQCQRKEERAGAALLYSYPAREVEAEAEAAAAAGILVESPLPLMPASDWGNICNFFGI